MRILITGITGFVGGHLTELLLAEGTHQLFGLSRQGSWPDPLKHLENQAKLYPVELTDIAAVTERLREIQPDGIFHLAGYANTRGSYAQPAKCWSDNVDATIAFYDAIQKSGIRPRIVFASSGLVYGEPDPQRTDLDESSLLKPVSPYATSKAAADLLSYAYTRHPGIDIIRVRLFNQIGPRQSTDYAIASFAHQIADAEAGRREPIIRTLDLSAHRDLTDVRDMASALWLLLQKGRVGDVYNAGRGQTWRIQDVLDRMVKQARIRVEVQSKVEPGAARETAITRADTRLLRAVTGWEPRIDLDQTLADTLDFWRKPR